MKEDFVTYDLAVKLKEKGFKDKCFGYYTPEGYEFLPVQTPFYGGDYEDCMFSHNDMHQGLDGSDCVDAPTISQVLKWLRDKKKIFVATNIGYCYESDEIPFPTNPKMKPILKGYYYGIWELDNLNDKYARSEYFEAPEFAILAGIEYVIDNLI